MTYTKYGDEWEREVMRNDKHAIVNMLRRVAVNSDAELAAKDAEIEALKGAIKKIRPHLYLYMFGEKHQDMMKAYLSELDAVVKGNK